MTPSEAAQFLPILKAYAEGKVIQVNDDDGNWVDVANPHFTSMAKDYRVKPDPTYTPWTFETCPVGAVVRHKGHLSKAVILAISKFFVTIGTQTVDYETLLSCYALLDGAPCGTRSDA